MLVFGLFLAGVIGAPTRYLVDGLVSGRTGGELPLGTFDRAEDSARHGVLRCVHHVLDVRVRDDPPGRRR